MKKIIIAFILFGSAYQLKAQQVKVNPADSILASINNSIKAQNNSWKQLTSGLKADQVLALYVDKTDAQASLNNLYFSNNMPVVVLPGNSKMPVARLDGYDKMPVKSANSDNGVVNQQFFKSLPTFRLPAELSPAPVK
ncbi:hypothetical protein [Mucilaginibacter flavidus]|uniref:hypothetical protein n=1 Tax=Mucilaginibacter flavidus TaxID=2949309 RepID=UPI0020926713|nr:hypothetical protein [Mucilaginibacter flavidus]MCO5946518.1 hypothetical protein [Mucilaginibacter flavidus]